MKNKKKFLKICIAVLLVVAVSLLFLLLHLSKKSEETSDEAVSETIFSCDFNSGFDGFYTDAYYTEEGYTEFSYCEDGGPDGSGCIKIENILPNDARYVMSFELSPKQKYVISGKIKLESIDGENAKGANLSFYSLTSTGFYFIDEPCDWTDFTVGVTVDEKETLDLCLRLGYFCGDTAGVVYFDDIKLETVTEFGNIQVATIANGDSSTAETTEAQYDGSTYKDMRVISWIIVLMVALFFAIWYGYANQAGKTNNGKLFETDFNLKKSVIVMLFVAFAIRVILSISYYECTIDVNLFKYWGNAAALYGPWNIYSQVSNCDYPPLYIYFLAIFSKLSGGSVVFYTILVKILPIICDIAIGWIIYKTATKSKLSAQKIAFFTGLWLFNPLVILDSACWGQVDSVLTLFVLGCILLYFNKKYLLSGVCFGLGVMLKPQMIIFLPVFGCLYIYNIVEKIREHNGKKGFANLGFGVLGGVGGLVLPCLPFINMGLAECEILGKAVKLPWIFSLFFGTIDHYSYATVNCYNFWFLMGCNWVDDSEMVGSLSIYSIGMLAIVATSLICVGAFAYAAFSKSRDKIDLKALTFNLTAMMYLMVSNFGPRMHERYFFPAVAMLLIAYIYSGKKSILVTYILSSVFGFISVHEIMLGLLCGGSIKDAGGSILEYGDYYWPSFTKYRGVLAAGMVLAALLTILSMASLINPEEKGKLPNLFDKSKKMKNEKNGKAK